MIQECAETTYKCKRRMNEKRITGSPLHQIKRWVICKNTIKLKQSYFYMPI